MMWTRVSRTPAVAQQAPSPYPPHEPPVPHEHDPLTGLLGQPAPPGPESLGDAERLGLDGEPRRTPLRPLARILRARGQGEDPDAIARENAARRNALRHDRQRLHAQGRLFMLAMGFFCAFVIVGLRMAHLAVSDPVESRSAGGGPSIASTRADIVDRNGLLLATNLPTHSLYAHPREMLEPVRAARELARIFPDLDADRLAARFTGDRSFVWIKRTLSPEQMQAVHDIGEPGLLFGPREMRLYPNGALAAHILGGATFGLEGVHSAEVIGMAGIEKALDARLRDPARAGTPLRLSIDLSVQAALEEVLDHGMRLMNAKGAVAVLMEARSGEIVAMASLPDFDPNNRPRPLTSGDAGDSPLFNRAVQGLYELGSTFKPFTVAQALELGQVAPDTPVDSSSPLVWGKFKIRDYHNYGNTMSVTDVVVKSSNTGTARIARAIGAERQRQFLGDLGLLAPLSVELVEAAGTRPQVPDRWSELSTMTVSYGHGMSTSPLHLAAGYAALVNGGTTVRPTLLAAQERALAPAARQVIRPEVSAAVTEMMRQVVDRGTASLARVPAYPILGKTGTAEKPRRDGPGYDRERVIATFAGAFPADDPRYVIVVSLDEPVENSGSEPRRTAGWTAVPVTAQIVRRSAPLLGLSPQIEPRPVSRLLQAAN